MVEALSFQITQDPEFYFKIDEQIDELLETQQMQDELWDLP